MPPQPPSATPPPQSPGSGPDEGSNAAVTDTLVLGQSATTAEGELQSQVRHFSICPM